MESPEKIKWLYSVYTEDDVKNVVLIPEEQMVKKFLISGKLC